MVNSLKQTLIVTICGAIFVAFLAFLIILRHIVLNDYLNDVQTTDKKFSQVLARNITYDIERALEMGRMMAEYPNLPNVPKDRQQILLTTMQKREPDYEYLALTDTNDKIILASDNKFLDVDKTSYEWYKIFSPNYEAGISPAYFSEKTKKLVITFVEGVKQNGEVKGAVIGDINLTSLQTLLQNFNADNNCQAYLIDRSGNAISQPESNDRVYNYRSMNYSTVAKNSDGYQEYDDKGHLKLHSASFFAPKGLSDSILAAMNGESGTVEYLDNKGNRYFCCYQPVEIPMVKTKWSLVIVHPVFEMISSLDSNITKALVGGVVLVIFIAFAMSYFAKKITEPIMAMTAMANRVRSGDLSGQLDIKSGNEIGELASNINHMIQGLRTTREKSQEAESRIKAIAYHDALTGLPNRNHFLVNLRKIIDRAVRGRFYGALIFVDVDKFKSINDTYGHAVGDGLLIEFGKRLIEIVGIKESVCRYGGDEFLVFLIAHDEEDAHSVANALVNKMREPFNISGHEFKLSASLGVALMPKDADNLDDLMERADAALYVSKRNGRDQFNFYEDGMTTVAKNIGNDF